MEESKLGHGGAVKSLLCMCAIQEDGQRRGGVHNSLISVRVVLLEPLFGHEGEEEEEEVAALADAVCCCTSGQLYFLFLDRLYFQGTVNNPGFLHASLNSSQALQSRPPGRTWK